MEIKITIAIAIYNVSDFLDRCLCSVIKQTYKNIEILLINDGSTDESSKICEYFAKSDSRIKLINKKNGGLVSARKEAAKIATGDYIIFIDGDDWIEIDMIERLVQPILTYSGSIDMVIGNYIFEFPTYNFENRMKLNEGLYNQEEIGRKILPKLIYPRIIDSSVWTKLIKKEIVLNNIFDIDNRIQIGEDTILTTGTILDCQYIYILGQRPLYHYRQNENSMTKKYKKRYFENTLILVENLKEQVEKKGRADLISQINQMLVTFSFLAIENEYISKYHSIKIRKKITKSIVYNRELREALKDMELSTLNLKNKIYYYLVKYKLTTVLCNLNLIIRGIKNEKSKN